MSRQFDLGRVKGQDFKILGQYDTLADLQEAHPDPELGDAYEVGESAPYDVYMYLFVDSLNDYGWLQQGTLRGPKGDQGETGPAGPEGPPGSAVIYVTDELDEHGGTIRHINGVDISNDTVVAEALQEGYTAHDSQGQPIVGTASLGSKLWFGTRAEYNALELIDPDTCYCIEEGT